MMHFNMLGRLEKRKNKGPLSIRRTIPTEFYDRMNLQRKFMGHLSSVYCVCFDHSGQFIFTGSDDHLIKVWSARDGRLLSTLRGHDGEITDMSVDYNNRLLASGGMDRVIRIWDIKTSKCLECLSAHTAMVTSVKFSPYNRHGKHRYLVSTSNDGCVVFWSYSVDRFEFKKVKRFYERSRPGGRMIGSSFSTGGSFLACVASDNFIHLYGFHPDVGPYPIMDLEKHTDAVDSVQFSNYGFRFVSGSADGTALIWSYKKTNWTFIKLDMSEPDLRIGINPRVLIVQWSRDDKFVITSTQDHKIKVWDSTSGELVYSLMGHNNEIYLLESHPLDPRIFISASHDGTIIIWDIEQGKLIKKFFNRVDTDSIASIYDIKFSPDGNTIAATDSHGYLSIYGFGNGEAYRDLPPELFFHTDYRALIRDSRNFVLDDQTHMAPHLMPPPTLVDMNGNPYPQPYQRFVPRYDGEKVIVPPLDKAHVDAISRKTTEHSRREDEEYLHEMHSDDDDTIILEDDDATIIYDDDATEVDSDGTELLDDTYFTTIPSSRYNTRSRGTRINYTFNGPVRTSARLRNRDRKRCRYS